MLAHVRSILGMSVLILLTFTGKLVGEEDMAALLREGAGLIAQKQTLEDQFDEHLSLLVKVLPKAKPALQEMTQLKREEDEFNPKCNRTFHRGEESALASCQQQRAGLEARYTATEQKLAEYKAWMERYGKLRNQYLAVKSRYESWERHMKFATFAAGIRNCVNRSTTGTPEDIVNSYQQCFDGANQASPLRVRAGTAFYNIPANPSEYSPKK